MSCLRCRNFNFRKWGTCRAFPKDIPFGIVSGEFIHTKHYPGDNNILFEDNGLRGEQLATIILYELEKK